MPTPDEARPDQAPRLTHAESARTLLAGASRGVLSTLESAEGYPYGSLVEYVAGDDGDAIFLLSDLAEHTANFKADGRASLFVSPAMAAGRPLAHERVTLLGAIEPVDAPEAVESDYLDAHPHASGYVGFSDFSFWRLHVQRARYIGGFGRMSWVDDAAYHDAAPDPLVDVAASAIAHMNVDHRRALVDYARAFGDFEHVEEARMIALDRLGFDLQVTPKEGRQQLLRVGFDEPLERPEDVRPAMVAMVDRARDLLI